MAQRWHMLMAVWWVLVGIGAGFFIFSEIPSGASCREKGQAITPGSASTATTSLRCDAGQTISVEAGILICRCEAEVPSAPPPRTR